MKTLTIKFFSLLVFCLNYFVIAQTDIYFEKLNLEKGDIQSIVYSVCYDKNNNAWFATEEGVLRYNSKEVFSYNTNHGIPIDLGNRIFSIFKTKDHSLWIGSEKGAAVFDPKQNKFIEVQVIGKKRISKTNQIVEDEFQNVWIASNNGIWKFNKNQNQGKLVNFLNDLMITSVCAYGDKIVFTSNKGVYSFSINNQKILFNTLKRVDKNNITNGMIIKFINNQYILGSKSGDFIVYDRFFKNYKAIEFSPKQHKVEIRDIEFKKGHYYVAIDGEGLMVLDQNFKLKKQYYYDENIPESISSNGLYDIYFGKDDIDWYATYGGGVNYNIPYKKQFTILKHEINNNNSLSNNVTRAILEVNNSIWFGTKKGISIYDKINKSWKHISYFPNQNDNTEQVILSLAKDGNHVWAGSYYHGLYRIDANNLKVENFNSLYPNKKIKISKIFKVFIDKQKNIWLGGIENKLSVVTQNNVLEFPIYDIRDINQDINGNIIAVGKNGVYSINLAKKTFYNIRELKSSKGLIEYNTINSIVIDYNNYLLGTNGAGLIIYNTSSRKVNNIDRKKNLLSNIVQGIIKYNNSNYWIATTKGISNLAIKNNIITINNYTKADGLANNEFNYGSYAKLSNGEMAFGGVDGVTIFNPKLLNNRKFSPNLFFEEFYVNNNLVQNSPDILPEHINETKEINLKYNQNSISIKYIGILLGFSNKVKYSYKLEGFDENWSESSIKNFVNYTNLNPGEYTFKVKASDELGRLGQEKSIKIHISKPWYFSNLAIFLYLILIALAIYALIRFIKILEIKKNKEEQINFFNNITHEIKTPLAILLNSLEDNKSNENARIKSNIERINKLINQMLHFQRYSLMDSSQIRISKVPIDQFVKDMIKDFKPLLEQKKLEVEFNNKYSNEFFFFDADLLNKVLFNLLSNAVKYSFETQKIIFNLNKLEKDKLQISVQDFGIGIPKFEQKNISNKFFRAKNTINNHFSGTGLGLMIVKNIVEKVGGTINFESEEGKGTLFRVHLPSQEKLFNKTPSEEITTIENVNEDNISLFKDKKILVLEDSIDLREHLVNKLQKHFLVFSAKDGIEGLQIAENILPDLIITDYMMPEMNGNEFTLKIRQNENLDYIPIFMLTALQDSSHKKESIEIGVTEYIEKPVSSSFLLAKIVNYFSWQEKLKKHYTHLSEVGVVENNKNIKENEFLVKLESIILEKITDEDFTLLSICDKIGMSRTSLYMKLKNLIDLSPQDFIINVKLQHAKKLLLQGDLNIKEVAYASGFSNPKYFSTSFKKVYGISPSDFIKGLNS